MLPPRLGAARLDAPGQQIPGVAPVHPALIGGPVQHLPGGRLTGHDGQGFRVLLGSSTARPGASSRTSAGVSRVVHPVAPGTGTVTPTRAATSCRSAGEESGGTSGPFTRVAERGMPTIMSNSRSCSRAVFLIRCSGGGGGLGGRAPRNS